MFISSFGMLFCNLRDFANSSKLAVEAPPLTALGKKSITSLPKPCPSKCVMKLFAINESSPGKFIIKLGISNNS